MIVIPAIIPHTKEQMTGEMKLASRLASRVQIDIADGVFVPVKTWPYNGRDAEYYENLKGEEEGWPYWEECEVELHLMVKNPETVIAEWAKTGIVAVVAHIEATEDFQKVIDICRELSISVGVAIKPSTDADRIAPFVDQVDFIQCMGSDMLGKHGVHLEDKALVQIQKLRTLYPERIIAIDIGVDLDTKERIVKAGATKLVSGAAILLADDPEAAFEELSS